MAQPPGVPWGCRNASLGWEPCSYTQHTSMGNPISGLFVNAGVVAIASFHECWCHFCDREVLQVLLQ